jgi:hypothetical protein
MDVFGHGLLYMATRQGRPTAFSTNQLPSFSLVEDDAGRDNGDLTAKVPFHGLTYNAGREASHSRQGVFVHGQNP